jgi:L-threonylcarbamoyladenylate synthase
MVDPEKPDPAALDVAAGVLRRGGLVAFATETVYGLGGIATDPAAVARIFAAKCRPSMNPLIVHTSGVAPTRECVAEWPEAAETLARRFWPGPLTLVLPRSARIPDLVTAGRSTVALRVPATRVALNLIERAGQPVAAPSANRSNRLSPTRAEHVLADLDGQIDLVLDSGPTTIGLESTVIDLTTTPLRILRPGPITAEELQATLGGQPVAAPVAGATGERPSAPGQLPVHYAPRTPAFRVRSATVLQTLPQPEDSALIVLGQCPELNQGSFTQVIHLDSAESAARRLYEVLHACDRLGVLRIVVLMPPDQPEWQAVRDRVLRATKALE